MNPFYIYALKDPRISPARPFYIGKGTGIRAWSHTIAVDESRKGRRIAEILSTGLKVVTTILADDLTETQALKLEAELVSAFGTEDTGGLLTNSVIPSGQLFNCRSEVIISSGIVEKAQIGLEMLKSAVIELLQTNSRGLINAEVTKALGLQSDYGGGTKDYLAWSILGILMREGKVVRISNRRHQAVLR